VVRGRRVWKVMIKYIEEVVVMVMEIKKKI